jgi:hypothetical protein
MCMRLGLNQAKNGFLCRFARSMKSIEALRNSSSIVSIRFLVSGPVFYRSGVFRRLHCTRYAISADSCFLIDFLRSVDEGISPKMVR